MPEEQLVVPPLAAHSRRLSIQAGEQAHSFIFIMYLHFQKHVHFFHRSTKAISAKVQSSPEKQTSKADKELVSFLRISIDFFLKLDMLSTHCSSE